MCIITLCKINAFSIGKELQKPTLILEKIVRKNICNREKIYVTLLFSFIRYLILP